MKEPKHFLCKKRKKIFLIEKTPKMIIPKKKTNRHKSEYFQICQKDTEKVEQIDNNITLNLEENNEKTKENQRHSLIQISQYVLNYIKQQKYTTGNDVTKEIKKRLQPQKEDESTQKNIQRRVYDAINVMGAIGLIRKNKQKIQFIDYLPKNGNNVIALNNDDNNNDNNNNNDINKNDIDNGNDNDIDSEFDEEKYNLKVKEELQIMLIKKYLALDFYKVVKSLGNLKEKENIYKENIRSPIFPVKYDEQGRIKIDNKNEFINYLNYLRYLMGYSTVKHSSPFENIKDFVKKDILSRINDSNNNENDNINKSDDIPNNKKFHNKTIANSESQPHIFITKTSNNVIDNELNNEKEIKNLGNEDKKLNFLKDYKKGNDIENDDTLNYLRKTKKFMNEISSADTLDYEINSIEIDIDKEENNTNRKISDNNKSIKSYADSNIKQDIQFMNNLNHFNFNS